MARQMSSVVFGIVVVVDFQSVFHLEMHQNNIFFIFLNSFLTSTHQNNPKTTKKIHLKQKKFIFFSKA